MLSGLSNCDKKKIIWPKTIQTNLEKSPWPRSHWTPHWSPNSRKGRSRPRRSDQRAILILLGTRIKTESDRPYGLMGDQNSSGNAKGDQTPQFAGEQCSFEPTSIPQTGDQCAIILKWERDCDYTPATNLVAGSRSRNCGSSGNAVVVTTESNPGWPWWWTILKIWTTQKAFHLARKKRSI